MSNTEETLALDQKFLDKQSRTIGTYGLETMAKLVSFKVLIIGCNGVGIETAKNLTLAGVHTINLYDNRIPRERDMGVNFAVTKASLRSKKTLAEVSRDLIAELNPHVRVRVVTAISEDVLKGNDAVIFTSAAPDLSSKTLIRWNKFCRSQSPAISFFLAFQGGALASVFVDHGGDFTVKDGDGRPMLQKSITEVLTMTDSSGDSYSRIRYSTPEGQTPGALRDYTQIKLTEVEGLSNSKGESVNGVVFDGVVCPSDPRDTVRVYPSFKSLGYSDYVTGGFLHELKEEFTLHFRPLESCIQSPGTFVSVSPMMDNVQESLCHLTAHALLRFADANEGRLPKLHDPQDSRTVLSLAKKINEENKCAPVPTTNASNASVAPAKPDFPFKCPPNPPPVPLCVDEINENFVSTQALLYSAELQPLASFLGAVVAQEVVKIARKYTPIHQWFHLDVADVLPDGVSYSWPDFKLSDSRYDNLIAIFGKSFQETLTQLKVFMVGCGALGCENIKNFALCGISCGSKGSLVVTDHDRIEISNLSRQFLFREDNVGQQKSIAAGARMKQMNPSAKVDARQDYVGASSEHIYTDAFWQGLDVVVNALDNMETRLYIDQQCVRYKKVLVEAGTMGTGGNVDIIVPGKTSSYADGGSADQTGGIPMCTLRNFPYIFDHCIEWARALFDDLFVSPMRSVERFLEDPNAFKDSVMHEINAAQNAGEKRSLIEKHLGPIRGLKRILHILVDRPTLDLCVRLAWEDLFSIFRDRIRDLQNAFPRDAKKKNGDPFWSGHRKYPSELNVTAKELASSPEAVNFLVAATNLYASMFGVHPQKHEARFNDENNRWMHQYRSLPWIQGQLATHKVPEYVPGSVEGLDEDTAENAAATSSENRSVEDLEKNLYECIQELVKLAGSCRGTKAAALDFEKDDDDNFHIDFVASASNLRAMNYSIPTQDRMKVKLVAGKIIPAIATTTSAVTGLALIELFKVLIGKDVSALRNGMLDVGTNNYVLFERDMPITNKTETTTQYYPEQDYTYKKKIIRVPDGFTKYDMITIDITPKTTVLQFAESLISRLNTYLPKGADYSFEIFAIGVGKGMLWNGRNQHSNTNKPLMALIEEQKIREAAGSLPQPFWAARSYFFDLAVSISLDDGDESVDEVEVDTATIALHITE